MAHRCKLLILELLQGDVDIEAVSVGCPKKN